MTTYTIDAYLSTQCDESDPDPYFHMIANNTDELETSLCEMIRDDFDNVLDVVLKFHCDDEPNVTMYDVVAIHSHDRHDDVVIAVAYIETTN